MSRNHFWQGEKAALTVMVQADNPKRVKELLDKARHMGAEAFGIQLERMNEVYKSAEEWKALFAYGQRGVYLTNYRSGKNEGKKDERLAEELLEAAVCGAELCDMMGDLFDRQPGEMTYAPEAVEKQKAWIEKLHRAGASVLMSSHIMKFTPAEEVLKIALAQQSRGADVCKIVVGAENMEEQLENLKIMYLLKKNLKIPFLFLSGGECALLRRGGVALGCCMTLCVAEHDAFSTTVQPLLQDARLLRELLSHA